MHIYTYKYIYVNICKGTQSNRDVFGVSSQLTGCRYSLTCCSSPEVHSPDSLIHVKLYTLLAAL